VTVPTFQDQPETVRGRLLYQSLLAVHAIIRSDLARVDRLPDPPQGGVRS
jgi:hypothetical protein